MRGSPLLRLVAVAYVLLAILLFSVSFPYLRAAATLAHWRGAPGEAIGQLREAAALAEVLALPGEAWEIAAALGQALRDGGDEAAARQEFARSGRIVRVLADKLPDAGLRASFLAQARGRGVSGA